MRSQLLVLVSAAAMVACASTDATRGGHASAWDRNLAAYRAAWLYREAARSLADVDQALTSGDRTSAQAAWVRARACANQPQIVSNPDWHALEARLQATRARLNGETPAAPVAVAAPMPAPVASASVAAPPPAPSADPLIAAIAEMTKARTGLHGHELSTSDVEVAERARGVLSHAVADGKPFADDDDTFRAQVKAGTELLAMVAEDIRLAHLIADFVAGPGAAHKKGYALSQRAGAERDNRRRQAALRAARDAFQDCVVDSRRMISEAPVLTRTALFLAANRTSPKKIVAACEQQQRALAKRIASR